MYLKLTGELDLAAAPAVRRKLRRLNGPGIVDLAGVTLLSAAGLSELVRLATRVGPMAITLINGSPQIHRVLYLVGLDRLFVIVDACSDTRARRIPLLIGALAPRPAAKNS